MKTMKHPSSSQWTTVTLISLPLLTFFLEPMCVCTDTQSNYSERKVTSVQNFTQWSQSPHYDVLESK